MRKNEENGHERIGFNDKVQFFVINVKEEFQYTPFSVYNSRNWFYNFVNATSRPPTMKYCGICKRVSALQAKKPNVFMAVSSFH